ncbi:MAG: hypothetical protein RR382_00040 [Tannerellaceae bacterium]
MRKFVDTPTIENVVSILDEFYTPGGLSDIYSSLAEGDTDTVESYDDDIAVTVLWIIHDVVHDDDSARDTRRLLTRVGRRMRDTTEVLRALSRAIFQQ